MSKSAWNDPDFDYYAPPKALDSHVVQREEPPPFLGYAGFWRRFAAHLIDSFVLIVSVYTLAFGILILIVLHHTATGNRNDVPSEGVAALSQWAFWSLTVALFFAYYAGLESSPRQATFGKLMMGIKVTDLSGRRVSLLRALGRLFAKIPSASILCLGYLMAGFTPRKQALHDLMAGTLVVLAP